MSVVIDGPLYICDNCRSLVLIKELQEDHLVSEQWMGDGCSHGVECSDTWQNPCRGCKTINYFECPKCHHVNGFDKK